jgi:dihydrofolate reductase
MARLCYSVAMSLDGYIAGRNGEADWIGMDPDVDFAQLWSRFDILLLGRKTFEKARSGFEQFGTQGSEVVVASRTLRTADAPKATIISEVTPDTIKTLRARAKKDIWLFGGGELFRSLLAIGAVDSVEATVIPILLGDGLPLLPFYAQRTGLKLVEHKLFRTGRMLLKYDIQDGLHRRPI